MRPSVRSSLHSNRFAISSGIMFNNVLIQRKRKFPSNFSCDVKNQLGRGIFYMNDLLEIHGTPGGKFDRPRGIAVNSSGFMLVADTVNDRIQEFQLANPYPGGILTQVVPGVCFSKTWGSHGSGKGQFKGPWDVVMDSLGNVFVADLNNHRIQKFLIANPCPGGILTQVVPGVCFIKEWGSPGSAQGQFNNPYGVGVDSKGNVFVADMVNNRIQMFQLNRCPVGMGTTVARGVCLIDDWGSIGIAQGQFVFPHGLDADSSGIVFVADTINNRIQIFADDTKPEIGKFKP